LHGEVRALLHHTRSLGYPASPQAHKQQGQLIIDYEASKTVSQNNPFFFITYPGGGIVLLATVNSIHKEKSGRMSKTLLLLTLGWRGFWVIFTSIAISSFLW
jgi:hypothetical protein